MIDVLKVSFTTLYCVQPAPPVTNGDTKPPVPKIKGTLNLRFPSTPLLIKRASGSSPVAVSDWYDPMYAPSMPMKLRVPEERRRFQDPPPSVTPRAAEFVKL